MVPFEYMVANGKIKVHFICTACGHTHRNKTAGDDAIACLDEKIKFWKKKYPHIS
jgi:rubrerythrin